MRDGLAALLCVALAGCSYDWDVPGADASSDVVSDTDAATVDAHDAAAATDAPVEGTSVDAPVSPDAVVDVVAEVDCAKLQNAVQAALPAALVCQGFPPDPTACTTAMQDPCGCTLYAGSPGSAATDYQNAVKALDDAGCKPTACGTCPVAPKGTCLVTDAGGQNYACYE
jgi:hypothetical protein